MPRHIPVLLTEVLENLQLENNSQVIDCTLGDGGHAQAILEKITSQGKLLGIDADPESLLRTKRYLYKFADQFIGVRDNFVNLKEIAKKNNFNSVQAILMDLGWSSPQFTDRQRGFSFQQEQDQLDMRFSGQGITAGEILNSYSQIELANIFRKYGEEKFSQEIAKAIVEHRKSEQINIVKQLVEIILKVYQQKLKTTKDIPWTGGLHPATKVFQALRIAVNNELEVLRQALPQAIDLLAGNGRLAVISFHSLEDRIVKQFFKSQANKTIKIINKKPIIASETEIKTNPRSRSAKLRVVEKLS